MGTPIELAVAIGLSIPKTAFITPIFHGEHTLTIWLAFGQLAFATTGSRLRAFHGLTPIAPL